MVRKPRTGRNQTTDDHVFLQTAQVVFLAHDGGFGQHAGRFLEGSRGDEAVGGQRRLRNTEEHVFVLRRGLAGGDRTIVLIKHFRAFDLFARDELRVARIGDLHAAQHLTNNHFNVLVVDLHALQTVHVLNFIHDVTGEFFDTEESQNVVRIRRSFHDFFTALHHLTVVHEDLLILADEEFVIVTVVIGNDEALLALRFLTERDGTRRFGEHTGILRAAGFEEFGHTRQTARNVSGLLAFARDTCEHFALVDFLAVAHHDDGAHRQLNRHRVIRARNLHFVTGFVEQMHQRTNHVRRRGLRVLRALCSRRRTLRVNHDHGAQARHFVHLVHHGDVFNDVLKLHGTGVFRNNRQRHRVEGRQLLTALHFRVRLNLQRGAVRHLMTFTFTARVGIRDDQFAGTGNDDQFLLAVLHIAHRRRERHQAGVLRFNARSHRRTGRRTTDVERTHRQLRTRFADGLSSDNAHGFAGVHERASAQVAAVALRAQAVAGLTGQGRTHLHRIHAFLIELVADRFVDQRARGNENALVVVQHVFGGHSAQHAVAQSLNDFTAFDQRAHFNAVRRTAVVFDHHQVLRHVDETTGEVTGVSRLQSRIGQALTGTVGRNKVLQNVQTLAEVRGNRGFDDGAVGLCHQTAHTGHLTNLSRRASGPGVSHHVNGVERFLRRLVAVAVDDGLVGEFLHHHLTHVVGRTTPNINDLVVAFALRHETGRVLLFNRLHFFFGFSDHRRLLLRNGHIADADRDTGQGRETVAVILQTVGKHHRGAQTALAEAAVDELGDFLLLQRDVEFGEAHAFRKDRGQQSTARGRFVTLDAFRLFAGFGIDVVFLNTHRAAGLQHDGVRVKSALHFVDVFKEHAFAGRIDAFAGRVVKTQHHILRGHDRRIAVRGEEDVVGGHHEAAGFQLGFERQRHVHGHLVTVEVSVKGRADQGVQLNGLTFDQLRFEGLNTQAVQRRSAVQHHRVFVNHFFQDIPHHGFLIVHHLLGALDRGSEPTSFELIEDEGLEEFESHQLRQTALVQTQFRPHRNHGTAGVVDALTQKVLTEATALTLNHVRQGLQGTLVGAGHRLTAATVVQKAVHRFLQHTLFVADDDVRCLQFEKTLQAVVAVDDAAIEIVQVGRRKAAAVQRHQRTQIRRQHRQDFENHPFGLDTGTLETFQNFEALRDLL